MWNANSADSSRLVFVFFFYYVFLSLCEVNHLNQDELYVNLCSVNVNGSVSSLFSIHAFAMFNRKIILQVGLGFSYTTKPLNNAQPNEVAIDYWIIRYMYAHLYLYWSAGSTYYSIVLNNATGLFICIWVSVLQKI